MIRAQEQNINTPGRVPTDSLTDTPSDAAPGGWHNSPETPGDPSSSTRDSSARPPSGRSLPGPILSTSRDAKASLSSATFGNGGPQTAPTMGRAPANASESGFPSDASHTRVKAGSSGRHDQWAANRVGQMREMAPVPYDGSATTGASQIQPSIGSVTPPAGVNLRNTSTPGVVPAVIYRTSAGHRFESPSQKGGAESLSDPLSSGALRASGNGGEGPPIHPTITSDLQASPLMTMPSQYRGAHGAEGAGPYVPPAPLRGVPTGPTAPYASAKDISDGYFYASALAGGTNGHGPPPAPQRTPDPMSPLRYAQMPHVAGFTSAGEGSDPGLACAHHQTQSMDHYYKDAPPNSAATTLDMSPRLANSLPPHAKLHEVWKGNEVFLCGGRIMMGPSRWNVIMSLLLIVAPGVVFAAVVAPKLHTGFNVSWIVVSAAWLALLAFSLLRTATMDPGVLPRNPNPPSSYLTGQLTRQHNAEYRGFQVPVRYNETTHFYQPPRAHHCSINDNCYDKFDHHCPWVGTTIARRNYRSFLIFIFGCTLLTLWTIVGCVLCIVQGVADRTHGVTDAAAKKRRMQSSLGSNWLAFVIGAYCAIAFCFVGTLSAFHFYLVSNNMTTYESFRIRRTGAENPFNRGCWLNWMGVCCAPTPPRHFDARWTVASLRSYAWWQPGERWDDRGGPKGGQAQGAGGDPEGKGGPVTVTEMELMH